MHDPARLLDEAVEELRLDLDARQIRALLRYAELLVRANRHHNLSGARSVEAVVAEHIVDCMAVIPAVQRRIGSMSCRVLDVGSGSGLPGLVLGLCMPEIRVTCVDAVAKKTEFIASAARELNVPVEVRHANVEEFSEGRFALIVCRAFSSLARFVDLTRHLLGADGLWTAMKGRPTDEELADVRSRVAMFHVEQIRVPHQDVQRCLVWMSPLPPPDQNQDTTP